MKPEDLRAILGIFGANVFDRGLCRGVLIDRKTSIFHLARSCHDFLADLFAELRVLMAQKYPTVFFLKGNLGSGCSKSNDQSQGEFFFNCQDWIGNLCEFFFFCEHVVILNGV